MSRLIIFVIVVGTTLFYWIVAGRIVWTAIVTGRLQARGVVYDREANPVMYRLGVTSWIVIIGFLTVTSIVLLIDLKNIF